jgi:hypothetical protein
MYSFPPDFQSPGLPVTPQEESCKRLVTIGVWLDEWRVRAG